MHGILLFAHGARDPLWARPFEAIAGHMRQQLGGAPVALAYLELMSPGLDEAAAALVQAGCKQLTVVPLFLGAGGHVRRDLPERVQALRQQWPELRIEATCAIGEADEVVRAIAGAAVKLALSASGPSSASEAA